MGLLEVYLAGALLILGCVVCLWLISLHLRDASIIDIFWGSAFVLAFWVYSWLSPNGYAPRQWLAGSLVTLWGMRLSLHILLRNRGRGEDFRYRKWRDAAGPGWWWQSLPKVFLLQGLLVWLISAPLLVASHTPVPARLGLLDWLAVPLWLTGFLFEALGDFQLARFRADTNNRGKVLRTGVWKYTRHPNYFGDAVQWWAFYLSSAAVAGGWWTVYSPVLMTFLLVRVSGAALLEETMKSTKPGFREYMESTSAFFPWFPRHPWSLPKRADSGQT